PTRHRAIFLISNGLPAGNDRENISRALQRYRAWSDPPELYVLAVDADYPRSEHSNSRVVRPLWSEIAGPRWFDLITNEAPPAQLLFDKVQPALRSLVGVQGHTFSVPGGAGRADVVVDPYLESVTILLFQDRPLSRNTQLLVDDKVPGTEILPDPGRRPTPGNAGVAVYHVIRPTPGQWHFANLEGVADVLVVQTRQPVSITLASSPFTQLKPSRVRVSLHYSNGDPLAPQSSYPFGLLMYVTDPHDHTQTITLCPEQTTGDFLSVEGLDARWPGKYSARASLGGDCGSGTASYNLALKDNLLDIQVAPTSLLVELVTPTGPVSVNLDSPLSFVVNMNMSVTSGEVDDLGYMLVLTSTSNGIVRTVPLKDAGQELTLHTVSDLGLHIPDTYAVGVALRTVGGRGELVWEQYLTIVPVTYAPRILLRQEEVSARLHMLRSDGSLGVNSLLPIFPIDQPVPITFTVERGGQPQIDLSGIFREPITQSLTVRVINGSGLPVRVDTQVRQMVTGELIAYVRIPETGIYQVELSLNGALVTGDEDLPYSSPIVVASVILYDTEPMSRYINQAGLGTAVLFAGTALVVWGLWLRRKIHSQARQAPLLGQLFFEELAGDSWQVHGSAISIRKYYRELSGPDIPNNMQLKKVIVAPDARLDSKGVSLRAIDRAGRPVASAYSVQQLTELMLLGHQARTRLRFVPVDSEDGKSGS
ncbi:MAG: hypothetical protein WCD37_14085, partial [Chloroflexia bacterium]